MERQIAAISPTDAGGFDRFMQENREKLHRMEPCLETPFSGWRSLCQTRLLKMLPLLRPHQSIDSYLKRFFRDERIRLAFSFQSKYLGMSPFRCPSLFSILSFIEFEHGVFHPIGGCGAVSRAMANVATEFGVEIAFDHRVDEILFRGRRAVGIRAGNEIESADAIIMNADFARAASRLIPNHLRRRWSDRKIARKKFSCSTFMMYLGIEGKFDLPHHNIYIAKDYARNLAEIEDKHVLSEDPSLYVQNACVTDPTLAPKGLSTLYVLAPVTHQHPNVNWEQERQRFRQRLLRQIAKAGFHDVEPRIRFERIITPNDWDFSYEIHRGATFNLAHSLDQMLHLRPRNRFEDVDGIYLVGGGTHPGSGLPVIFESARISTRLLLEDLNLSTSVVPPLTSQAILNLEAA
jgi:phytoene desaturase